MEKSRCSPGRQTNLEGTTSAAGGLPSLRRSSCDASDVQRRLSPQTSDFQGPTEPAKAPKGVKLAIVSCSATLKGCQIPAEAAVEAAKALGWEAAIFDGRANPKDAGERHARRARLGRDRHPRELHRLSQHPAPAGRGEESRRARRLGRTGRRHAQCASRA